MTDEFDTAKDFTFGWSAEITSDWASELEQRITELFELLKDPLYRYLLGMLGNESEAEDLTQETFLRLHAHLQAGKRVQNCRAWIFRVAHNLAIDYHRTKSPLHTLDTLVGAESLRQNPSPTNNAEENLLEEEKEKKFWAAMARLSEDERRCLDLRAEGLRYREIAEVLGMRISTIENILIRTITKLKKGIDDSSAL